MDTPKRLRRRLRLRSLLSVVFFCAVGVKAYLFFNPQPLDERIKQVKVGMAAEDVRSLLGEPYLIRAEQGGESWFFEDRKSEYWIDVRNGKVFDFAKVIPG